MTDKAFRSIAAAHRNIKEEDYDFASSRAYYAVFYMPRQNMICAIN